MEKKIRPFLIGFKNFMIDVVKAQIIAIVIFQVLNLFLIFTINKTIVRINILNRTTVAPIGKTSSNET